MTRSSLLCAAWLLIVTTACDKRVSDAPARPAEQPISNSGATDPAFDWERIPSDGTDVAPSRRHSRAAKHSIKPPDGWDGLSSATAACNRVATILKSAAFNSAAA